jgi:hypothetical protein
MKMRAFLADGVQAVAGKLYVLGAGWNRLATRRFPARHDRIGIGALILVGDDEAGQHSLTLRLLDADGAATTLATDAKGEPRKAIRLAFTADGSTDGLEETIVPLALNLDGLVFSEPGVYAFELRIDDGEPERLDFKVDLAAEPAPGPSEATPPVTARTAGDHGYL